METGRIERAYVIQGIKVALGATAAWSRRQRRKFNRNARSPGQKRKVTAGGLGYFLLIKIAY